MGHNDFEGQVLSSLAELRTNMRRLVGEDGNGGVISELGERITAVEQRPNRWMGTAVSGSLGAGVMFLLGKISGH